MPWREVTLLLGEAVGRLGLTGRLAVVPPFVHHRQLAGVGFEMGIQMALSAFENSLQIGFDSEGSGSQNQRVWSVCPGWQRRVWSACLLRWQIECLQARFEMGIQMVLSAFENSPQIEFDLEGAGSQNQRVWSVFLGWPRKV